MYKFILFAGTVEGRQIAEFCDRHQVPGLVCVATEYGESLLPKGGSLKLSHRRLEVEEMKKQMEELESDGLVIDATHPYAQAVTENIRRACADSGREYLRLLRRETGLLSENTPESAQHPLMDSEVPVVHVENTQKAVEYLEQTKGAILVTTGSKELAAYTALRDFSARIYARVLPLPDIIRSCAQLGITGSHLIGMQGPFSQELNEAMLRQLHASWMVTKESGKAGGFLEKYRAARNVGCGLVVIGRPEKEDGLELEECLDVLRQRWGISGSDSCKKQARSLTVTLVGIGMGSRDTLTVEGERAIREAELLIGAERMLEGLAQPGQECFASYRPEEICGYLEAHPQFHRAAVVLSGDVGFYSGAKKLLEVLKERLPWAERNICCGISSMIYFCGKLEMPWDDVFPVSLHGKERNVAGLLRQHSRIFAIVGSRNGVSLLCRKLTRYGMGQTRVFVGERLSYPDERIFGDFAENLQECETDPLSVLLLERQTQLPCVTHGIPDRAFLRDQTPMTKEEVRSVSLSKLRLTSDALVYDVGAGTGSVSVEAALQAVDGEVWAIEKKEEAARLIRQNRDKFGADNLKVVLGTAPNALRDLPAPTHAFIGGSSGNLREILKLLFEKNPRIRVVINCITLETVAEAMECLRLFSVTDAEIVQVSVARGQKAGPYHLMMGQNPVSIISFTGAGHEG